MSLRACFLKILHHIQRSVFPTIVCRLRATLLSVALLLAVCPWGAPYAQGDTGVPQAKVQTLSPDRPEKVREESHELSSFFLIGIMINVLALVLFAVWASREWKKKKPVQRSGDG